MGLVISKDEKQPLPGVAGLYGVEDADSVKGLKVPISVDACYASLTEGRWRYWVRPICEVEAATFGGAVGSLLPISAEAFMAHLNDHATGPVRPLRWREPSGEAVIFDLPDPDVVERFALSCSFAEAIQASDHALLGAGHEAKARAFVIQDALPDLNTNLSLWAIGAPQLSLVLFPNAILLRRARNQWVIPYGEVACKAQGSEVRLALSDQRVRLALSSPLLATRASRSLERLVEFESRKGTHLGPKVTDSEARGRLRISSCGRIVVNPKGGEPASQAGERVVIKVTLGEDAPPPDPPDGVPTPDPAGDEAFVFCDDSGLTFATESQAVDELESDAPARNDESGVVLLDESQAPDAFAPGSGASPPPGPRSARQLDRVRAAVGAIMSYVARAHDHFEAPERAVIRRELELPMGFDLDRSYSAVRPGSRGLAFAVGVLRRCSPNVRKRALRACERVAEADTHVTSKERKRLDELRARLFAE